MGKIMQSVAKKKKNKSSTFLNVNVIGAFSSSSGFVTTRKKKKH